MLDVQPEQQQLDVSQLLNALSALVANQASVAIPACGMCAFVTVAGCVWPANYMAKGHVGSMRCLKVCCYFNQLYTP